MRFTKPTDARAVNRLRVLNLIASSEQQLSRAEVARILKLNKVSTGEIVDALVAENLVVEGGKIAVITGRPPTALSINKDAGAAVVIDLGTRNISVALVDLAGHILRFERFPTPENPQPEDLCVQLIKSCQKNMKLLKADTPVLGISVSVNGIIDEDGQILVEVPAWGWNQVPLAEALSQNTGLPVILERHVKAMVMAETWFGSLDPQDSVFYVNWGEHIASALVEEGKIFATGSEFGHVHIRPNGLCRCGSVGCLETVASGWAISQDASGLTVKQICQQTEANPQLEALIRTGCIAMAEALAAAVTITGCSRIILGGGISNLPDTYFAYLTEQFTRFAPPRKASIPIERTALGDKAGLLGSAAVALDTFLFKRSLLAQLDGTVS